MIEPKYLVIDKIVVLTRPHINKTDFSIGIHWSTSNIGFGEVNLYRCDGKLGMETETMSKEFVMSLFGLLYDEAIKEEVQS